MVYHPPEAPSAERQTFKVGLWRAFGVQTITERAETQDVSVVVVLHTITSLFLGDSFTDLGGHILARPCLQEE